MSEPLPLLLFDSRAPVPSGAACETEVLATFQFRRLYFEPTPETRETFLLISMFVGLLLVVSAGEADGVSLAGLELAHVELKEVARAGTLVRLRAINIGAEPARFRLALRPEAEIAPDEAG